MNRSTTAGIGSFEKKLIHVFARILFGASGVPTLEAVDVPGNPQNYIAAGTGGWMGIKSIIQNAAGDYTLTFQDNFMRLVGFEPTWLNPFAELPAAAPRLELVASGGSYAGTNMQAAGGATIEFLTLAGSSTSTSTLTMGGAALAKSLNGFTGTSSGGTTTITGGGATVAAHALAGATITDGTITTTILDNSALTATTGTITTAQGLASTITGTGNAWKLTGTVVTTTTGTGIPANPASGETLLLMITLGDSSSY